MTAISNSWMAFVAAAAAFAGVLYLFSPGLIATFEICWSNDDYSHGLILPFVAIYIIWTKREEIRLQRLKVPSFKIQPPIKLISPLGVLLLLVGLAGLLVGTVSNIVYIQWTSFFFAVSGVTLLVFGGHPPTYLIPAILLNFMAKPLPDSVVSRIFWPFQVLAAKVSAQVLELLNVPVYISGNVIEIPGMQLLVEEACSGMRSMMSLLTVALIVLFLIDLRFIAKLLIVALSVLVAILLNIVRVAMTGVLAHFYDPKSATGFFHTFSGMIVFLVGLTILYFLGSQLTKLSWARGRSR